MSGTGALLTSAIARAHATGSSGRTAVLVEGMSDYNAVRALAWKLGRDLEAEGVAVIAIAGATNIARFVELLGPHGYDVPLAGLTDIGEETAFREAIESGGLGSDLTRDLMEALGFFVCVQDLEDELIRALGPVGVEQVVEAQGELGRFRSFQNQPAQRERPIDAQLRRFMGTKSGRKVAYGAALVEALDLDRIPEPLAGLLTSV